MVESEDLGGLIIVAVMSSIIVWAGIQVLDAIHGLPIISTFTPNQQAQINWNFDISVGSLTAVDLSHWLIVATAILIPVCAAIMHRSRPSHFEPSEAI